MFRRPTAKSRKPREEVNLNLVPMMDALVTQIVFLLYTVSFIAIVGLESPVPITDAQAVEQKLKERPLQLTLTVRENDVELWSPFDLIPPRKIPNTPDGAIDLFTLSTATMEIKSKFPKESSIVLVPHGGMTYDALISVMDAVRLFEPTDPPLFLKDEPTQVEVQLKKKFDRIVFGNLLGDA
jgi:biopolymer transport protein ExbD